MMFRDKLIVGVQDDGSVLKQKGHNPIIPLLNRMEIISAIRGVDKVISYSNVYQAALLKKHKVNNFVVGAGYGNSDGDQKKTLEYCKSRGIKVIYVEPTEDVSSTEIKETIRGN